MPGLGLLSFLQPDLIKIDMELLRDIHLSRAKQVIVAGIVGIARALDIEVLGEGVESEEELIVLRAAGISLFQGYYFAKTGLDDIAGCADVDAAHSIAIRL